MDANEGESVSCKCGPQEDYPQMGSPTLMDTQVTWTGHRASWKLGGLKVNPGEAGGVGMIKMHCMNIYK